MVLKWAHDLNLVWSKAAVLPELPGIFMNVAMNVYRYTGIDGSTVSSVSYGDGARELGPCSNDMPQRVMNSTLIRSAILSASWNNYEWFRSAFGVYTYKHSSRISSKFFVLFFFLSSTYFSLLSRAGCWCLCIAVLLAAAVLLFAAFWYYRILFSPFW